MAHGEHQDGLVALNDDEAGVDAAVGATKLDASRWFSYFAQPFEGSFGLPGQSWSAATKGIDHCSADGLGSYFEGHTSSVTAAMSTPAMAVASPFLAASLLMMRVKKLGSVGVSISDMCSFLHGDEQMSLLVALMPEIVGELRWTGDEARPAGPVPTLPNS